MIALVCYYVFINILPYFIYYYEDEIIWGSFSTAQCYFRQQIIFCYLTVFLKPPTHSCLMWSDLCGELKTIITACSVFTFCLAGVSY